MADGDDYYLGNRSWMYKRKVGITGAINLHFLRGVEVFLKVAIRNSRSRTEIRCPCAKCKNIKYKNPDEVRDHLTRNGFVKKYYEWTYQFERDDGERPNSIPFVVDEDARPPPPVQSSEENPYARMVQDSAASTFPKLQPYSLGQEHHYSPVVFVPEEPNPQARQFYDLLNAANSPLYPGCETFTEMSMIGRMTNLKASYPCTEKMYDELCSVMRDALPKPNLMISGFYDMTKRLTGLGLPAERIDCCVGGCMIFWGSTENDSLCRTCGKRRWNTDANGKIHPRKQFYYLPLTPRLQRLYASQVTAGHMRWHDEHYREEEEMCHPSDSEAWLNFNATHPDFTAETRNVRLGLYTDGFNPFGISGKQYSSWPVILTPYNLPPWMCMKRPYMFLTVIIPGPDNPKLNIDIYLEPLIEELKMLWTEGVETYDASTRTNFRLRAALMWTISDFSAYSMLSGWSTHGVNACPHCRKNSEAFYLKFSKKVCWFDCHRRFLSKDHPFRRDVVNFLRQTVNGHAPRTATGAELLAELNDYGMLRVRDEGAREYNMTYGRQTREWKKRSIFWDLPYWESNMIRHCLDVMHIEKNFFENIFNTVMRVDGKSKDHLAARCDLSDLRIRSSLHPIENTFPVASFTLDNVQSFVLLQWLKTLRFPDGYVSDLARNIDMKKHTTFRMSSHDCHVFMQRLLPVAYRELLPKPIWEALTELSLFFKVLTSPKLTIAELTKLEKDIPVILCKLEKIFPPSFFDCMEHLPVHLPYEARVAGPAQYRWMYPFERYLRHLKQNVGNKAHVEASICNAYLTEEASFFVSHFFEPNVPCKIRNPPMHDDRSFNNDRSGVLSIFTHPVRFQGSGRTILMDDKDLRIAHRYVLFNCLEVKPYLREFTNTSRANYPTVPSDQLDAWVEDKFQDFFRDYARSGIIDNHENGHILREVAKGPLKDALNYKICYVNGYKFHTSAHDTRKAADNSGVCVKSAIDSLDAHDFYGRLLDIIEIEYPALPLKRVTLFKCHWYDPSRHETRVHDAYQLLDIHVNRTYRKYDPFVLASQASQVYYMPYPSTRNNLQEWRAVCKVRPNKYQASVEPIDRYDDNAFQEEEHRQFNICDSDNSMSAALVDPYGCVITCSAIPVASTEQDIEEELDEDLVLSGDEQINSNNSASEGDEEENN